MSLRAVIFDFDGLILDTEKAEFDSWQEVYQEHGVELDFNDWAVCIGTSGAFDPVGHLMKLTGLALDRDAVRAQQDEKNRRYLAGMTLFPGVIDRLDEAAASGLGVGLASSASDGWVVGNLRRHGILERFHAIRTRTQVLRAKPAPDLFLATAEALCVSPSESVVLEDSLNGVKAAKAAGMFCVAVPNGLTSRMDLSGADLRVSGLASFTLAEVGRLMEAKG